MSDLIFIEPSRAELETDAGPVPVVEVELGGTPRGLAVLVHDASAPPLEIAEGMNRWVIEGYESLAIVAGTCTAREVIQHAGLRGWQPEQVGLVGFGRGGTFVLEAAQRFGFGAAVSFSPLDPRVDDESSLALRTPWLGLFSDGARAAAGELARALDASSDVYSEVVVYPGVGSDFHRQAHDSVSYSASYDSWQRATEWLNARVAARLTPLARAWRSRAVGVRC